MSTPEPSEAFESLHPAMQKWVWRQGWAALRATQEQTIPAVLGGDCDVIVAAATAGGKTEAAFLPILSRLLAGGDDDAGMGLALYISPLKALINDQYGRLDLMTDGLDLPVVPWHGDIPQKLKHGFLKHPRGMLLITPESLEAICVTHGHRLASLFERLEYVVVDELHAFIGVERGMQLQSLMHRLELVIRRRVPRVGLSATLGDMQLAAGFLRPAGAQSVRTIVSTEDAGELKLQIRGYRQVPPALSPRQAEATEESGAEVAVEDTIQGDVLDISQHLFQVLRGTNNLVFANSRGNVETYADLLRRQCEQLRVPVEFFPHHGSLSKELREHVETGLKAQTQPVTAVCTSTLEMGIDIGSVASIAQIGPPHQVASMRQRLGRSGRRGEAAVLRIYIQEREIDHKTPAPDRLRPALFQAVAMTELLLSRWTEPPLHGALHLSTLIQQILSVIAQHGGTTAQGLWNALCENAPFAAVGQDNFVALLRRMGRTGLLSQSADGTLLHGEVGERIVNHYSFFAAFTTPEEFTLAVDGKVIGTLPIDRPVAEGDYLIFAGRRWRVLRLDMTHKRIDLARAGGGRAPTFGGTAGIVHDVVRAEMHDLYCGQEVPVYLDAGAQELLAEGRHHFHDLGLDRTAFLDAGEDVFVFPWAGDIALDTLAAMLTESRIRTQREGVYLCARDTTTAAVQEALKRIAARDQPAPVELAANVENKASEKYDEFLDDDLLSVDWASRRLDANAALQIVQRLCASN
ncbi:DEAD/DEAH box helicase [Spectribacter hydrogenooxidans]|uniref:DEAD/DEAH box helicase n=1 Tax=Spectribacter hydrogenoxidans TaxID=3075608 RepID=A0ABU3BXQ8_9GAMM|nr:DEAD/DEAH box helicase [Salinisphaera sp. W335]MDT0634112.1 DEAD/DEAH box helicase [Salinisphaera sp. W335]